MPHFNYLPEICASTGLIQTIELVHDAMNIGTAIWHADSSTEDGVIQILELNIDATVQRQGFGKLLMAERVRQTLAYQALRKVPLRRLWISMRQKTQIQGRAYVSGQGFIHQGTVKDLLTGEDAMIYVRTFD